MRLLLILAVFVGLSSPAIAQPAQVFGPIRTPAFDLSGVSPLNLKYASIKNPNAIMAGPGNSVSFCPAQSCVTDPNPDHQRASLLISAVTQDDMHSEEQTVGITTTINKGRLEKWATSKSFTKGQNVAFGFPRNTIYRQTVASCTSSPSGAGPVGQGAGIVDGSCRWDWINDAAIGAKVGLYVETRIEPGAGPGWGAAFNTHLEPGMEPDFNPGVEFDFTNHAKNCVIGVANCNNVLVTTGGEFKNTTGVTVNTGNEGNFATIWGLRVAGDWLASDVAIEIDAAAPVGLGLGVSGIGGQSHSTAGIHDASSGPRSLYVTGSHSVATIDDPSNSPTALNIGGNKSLAAIRDGSTTPNGIVLAGSYSGAQIVGNNFTVFPDGGVKAANFAVGNSIGATCNGPPTANFRVINGIVTAC